jgi:cytochrome P450
MSEKPLPTTFQLMGLDPATRDDPYPLLADLQARCPVHLDAISNQFVLTRYEDVKATVNDRTLWRHPSRARPDSMFHQFVNRRDERGPREGESILFMDDPDHARVRQPLTKAFYRRAARLRGEVETIVDDVLDDLAGRAQFDVIDDYGIPIPILVIAKVLGVEEDRLQEFRAWSEGIILSLHVMRTEEQTRQMVAADAALTAYFTKAMDDRRRTPRDDLITDMVQLQAEGAPLNDGEIRINLASLLVGGNLTTTDLIGNGVYTLLQHPEQLAALRADPGLAANAVEEILRFEAPVSLTSRVASREMQVGGCPVHAGDPMMTFIRAANRDPSVFEDPDSFDITRKRPPHMSFGGGAHICIGAPLARMEGQVAIPRLFERFAHLRLAPQSFTWRALPGFRGLEHLIVETGA